ncbi:MAG: mechanosensitive ion channel domain-containing protein [Ginsengibacter sp.]
MNFLDQIFLDNTIRSYIIAAIIILLAVILRRLISKYATALIFRLGKTHWSGLSKQKFDDIVVTPMERIVMVIVIIITLGQLHFPKDLLFSIHNVTSHDIINTIASAVFIIAIVSFVIRFMDFLALVIERQASGKKSTGRHQLLFFFKDLIRVIIIIFGIIFILKYSFNLDIGNLLTGLSIVGAALALSAKESLENLIASFIIFFDKPFETGDLVKVKDISGSVERIGLRSTRVRTAASSLVTIPNKQMVDSILDNWSERNAIRNEIKCQLAPATSSADLEKAVKEIENILGAEKEKIVSYNVYLQEITREGALITVVYFTKTNLSINDSNVLIQEINIRIRKMQEEFEIHPADSRHITLKSNDNP